MPGRKAAASEEPTSETLLAWWIGDQQRLKKDDFAPEREQVLTRLKRQRKSQQLCLAIRKDSSRGASSRSQSWNHHVIVATEKSTVLARPSCKKSSQHTPVERPDEEGAAHRSRGHPHKAAAARPPEANWNCVMTFSLGT